MTPRAYTEAWGGSKIPIFMSVRGNVPDWSEFIGAHSTSSGRSLPRNDVKIEMEWGVIRR